MAEIKWNNVDGSNMNTALGHLVQTNNIMYDRVKDLNQGLQTHLALMQEGLNDQHKYQTELNTDMVLNQLASAQSQEDIDRLTKLGLIDANALQAQYGSKIDLSKINQAKASWVADTQNRATAVDELKNFSKASKERQAQIQELIIQGRTSEANALLAQSMKDGVISNSLGKNLNNILREGQISDREFLAKQRLDDASIKLSNAQTQRELASANLTNQQVLREQELIKQAQIATQTASGEQERYLSAQAKADEEASRKIVEQAKKDKDTMLGTNMGSNIANAIRETNSNMFRIGKIPPRISTALSQLEKSKSPEDALKVIQDLQSVTEGHPDQLITNLVNQMANHFELFENKRQQLIESAPFIFEQHKADLDSLGRFVTKNHEESFNRHRQILAETKSNALQFRDTKGNFSKLSESQKYQQGLQGNTNNKVTQKTKVNNSTGGINLQGSTTLEQETNITNLTNGNVSNPQTDANGNVINNSQSEVSKIANTEKLNVETDVSHRKSETSYGAAELDALKKSPIYKFAEKGLKSAVDSIEQGLNSKDQVEQLRAKKEAQNLANMSNSAYERAKDQLGNSAIGSDLFNATQYYYLQEARYNQGLGEVTYKELQALKSNLEKDSEKYQAELQAHAGEGKKDAIAALKDRAVKADRHLSGASANYGDKEGLSRLDIKEVEALADEWGKLSPPRNQLPEDFYAELAIKKVDELLASGEIDKSEEQGYLKKYLQISQALANYANDKDKGVKVNGEEIKPTDFKHYIKLQTDKHKDEAVKFVNGEHRSKVTLGLDPDNVIGQSVANAIEHRVNNAVGSDAKYNKNSTYTSVSFDGEGKQKTYSREDIMFYMNPKNAKQLSNAPSWFHEWIDRVGSTKFKKFQEIFNNSSPEKQDVMLRVYADKIMPSIKKAYTSKDDVWEENIDETKELMDNAVTFFGSEQLNNEAITNIEKAWVNDRTKLNEHGSPLGEALDSSANNLSETEKKLRIRANLAGGNNNLKNLAPKELLELTGDPQLQKLYNEPTDLAKKTIYNIELGYNKLMDISTNSRNTDIPLGDDISQAEIDEIVSKQKSLEKDKKELHKYKIDIASIDKQISEFENKMIPFSQSNILSGVYKDMQDTLNKLKKARKKAIKFNQQFL